MADSFSIEGARSGQMHSLLGEFKGLYEGRLKRLDETEGSGDDTLKTRVRILQAYVNDLSEQNDVLVSTLEELEKEARERVNLLEKELKKASSSSKSSEFAEQFCFGVFCGVHFECKPQ
uniref:Uncharacterized protein n=1 Tax=Magallana gigas TaxID=29159 RepID=K1R9C8_MAGGI